MTYKETLFFIGKCLTINHEPHNKTIVEDNLKENAVDWESVVKVSTEHYVFPALYCNLKKADFLHYLPNDLVEYMKHITDLNRERNEQIIEQAKEINELLLAHNITPIFLKGTGNLLEGLYEDIAERMVGDIDFLVHEKVLPKTIDIIYKNEYKEIYKADYFYPNFKHYNRLQKHEKIAGIEIHKQMTIEKYAKLFNFDTIIDYIHKHDNFHFLGFQDQLKLSIIAIQINDNMQYFNTSSLRNIYDVFLLSQKVNSKTSIDILHEKLKTPLNNFLITANKTLNSNSITYTKNKLSETYLNQYITLISDSKLRQLKHKKIARKLFLKSRFKIILKAFYKKDIAIWLFKRITKGRVKPNS